MKMFKEGKERERDKKKFGEWDEVQYEAVI
jgi:hypothetical protein